MTSAFQGGQPMMELLNLWGASTENCGRLPYVDEMVEYMEKTGFDTIRYKNLMPGDSFYVFTGKRPFIVSAYPACGVGRVPDHLLN